jgi:hypothetical protein
MVSRDNKTRIFLDRPQISTLKLVNCPQDLCQQNNFFQNESKWKAMIVQYKKSKANPSTNLVVFLKKEPVTSLKSSKLKISIAVPFLNKKVPNLTRLQVVFSIESTVVENLSLLKNYYA